MQVEEGNNLNLHLIHMFIFQQIQDLTIYLLSFMPYILLVNFSFLISIKNERYAKLSLPVSLVFGPILISVLLELLLSYFPKEEDIFYIVNIQLIGIVSVIFTAFYWYKNRVPCSIDSVNITQGYSRIERLLTGLLFFALALMILNILFGVLVENDPLEYANTAHTIYQLKSLADYPFIETSVTNGYYGPWTHGLGYINLWTWSYFLSEYNGMTFSAEYISIYYLIALVIFLIRLSSSFYKLRLYGIIASIILFSTPVFVSNAIGSHLDIVRISLLFISLILFYLYLQDRSLRSLVFASLSIGLTVYTHSLNILMYPIIAMLWIIRDRKISLLMIRHGIVFLFLSILFILPRYIINIELFGSPIADSNAVPVWNLQNMHYDEWFYILRDISSQMDRFIYGLAKGFSRVDWFGYSYYLFTVTFLYYILELYKNNVNKSKSEAYIFTNYILQIILIFFSFVIISWAIGSDIFIKNYRYQLTIQPFITLFSAVIIFQLFSKKKVNNEN